MTPATPSYAEPAERRALTGWVVRHRSDLAWFAVVGLVYVATTIAVAIAHPEYRMDRAMTIATSVARGNLDSTLAPGSLDTVTVGDVTYPVISPLPIVPYLVFVPVPGLWENSRWIISTGIGIVAAWMTLPLARRYGPGGQATWWLATLGAFGTLLWTLSISGNFYYLAHVEATAFVLAALLEWRGRRRPLVIGLAIGLASLARPTILLAAIPFGVVLIASSSRRLWTALSFGLPLALAVAATALYNFVRFGSPLESGYGVSTIFRDSLVRERAKGVFSIRHLPDNLRLLLTGGFDVRGRFPWTRRQSERPLDPADVAWAAHRSLGRRALAIRAGPVGGRVPGRRAPASLLRGWRVSDLRVSLRARLHPVPARARRDRGTSEVRPAREGHDRAERRLRRVRHRVGRLRMTAPHVTRRDTRQLPCRVP